MQAAAACAQLTTAVLAGVRFFSKQLLTTGRKLSTDVHLPRRGPERAEMWQNPATTPHKCRLEGTY